jgi:hypothetical protein
MLNLFKKLFALISLIKKFLLKRMAEKSKSSITVTGAVTTLNSALLAWIFYRSNKVDEQVEDINQTTNVIKRNLNLLNMIFKTNIVETTTNDKMRKGEIEELRRIIMIQDIRLTNLEDEILRSKKVDDLNNDVYNPLNKSRFLTSIHH